MAGESRPPWYERFGGIGGSESATQSVARDGIPVPPGGTFQGRPPPRQRRNVEESLEERWSTVSRCDRRAEVTAVDWLTRTGTLRLSFEVTDGKPFDFVPGNFLRVERHDPERGYHRGTYCIASTPTEYHRFDLLVRVVSNTGMSGHLASLRLGDEIAFRGPTGRSMLRHAADAADLLLVATGVGIAPLYSLVASLLRAGDERPMALYWGLRTIDDRCLADELSRLNRFRNFDCAISLSQPDDDWRGLRGRLTESLDVDLDVPGRRYFLAGNGAMIEELASALSELGVPRETIYEEPYFNGRHVADPAVVAAIADRLARANA